MISHQPSVTIGMPVYNAQRYLEQALDSLLAQTYTDFELMIADNASTDKTQEICLAYAAKDSRIRYHRNEKNLGAAPNFNLLFQLSSSKYFKWAPYDDLVEPTFLARCVEVMEQHPEAVLCYCRAKIIDEQGAYVVDYNPGPDTSSAKPHERFGNLILRPEYAVQQMALIRSAILKATGLYGSFPSSDEVLLAELALRGRFYEIPERLYLYRLHEQQSNRNELKVQRARSVWFDSALAGKIVLPKWRYCSACLAVIQRTPLSFVERLRCYRQVGRWLLKPPNFRAMGKDVLLAATQLGFRLVQKSRAKVQQTIRRTEITT
ncbi:MAG: glycosyltransferase [Caldilineaceae bacterium]